jgi:hypothetical protein
MKLWVIMVLTATLLAIVWTTSKEKEKDNRPIVYVRQEESGRTFRMGDQGRIFKLPRQGECVGGTLFIFETDFFNKNTSDTTISSETNNLSGTIRSRHHPVLAFRKKASITIAAGKYAYLELFAIGSLASSWVVHIKYSRFSDLRFEQISDFIQRVKNFFSSS